MLATLTQLLYSALLQRRCSIQVCPRNDFTARMNALPFIKTSCCRGALPTEQATCKASFELWRQHAHSKFACSVGYAASQRMGSRKHNSMLLHPSICTSLQGVVSVMQQHLRRRLPQGKENVPPMS
jgi:hypothetical protein